MKTSNNCAIIRVLDRHDNVMGNIRVESVNLPALADEISAVLVGFLLISKPKGGNMRNRKLQERLFVRLPRDTEQALFQLAVMKGVTRSEVLREAIAEKLARELKTKLPREVGSEAEEYVKGDN